MGANGNEVRMLRRRFGRLTVLERHGVKRGHVAWLCRCDCGNEIVVRGDRLRRGMKWQCGSPKRCGLLIRKVAKDEEGIWHGMIERCYSYSSRSYRYYGKLGVRVCKRWKDDFSQFLSDMGPRPSRKHSIDRWPDPAGNYEPVNCRWATREQQSRNRRHHVYIKVNGEMEMAISYAERMGITYSMMMTRLKNGWELEDAVLAPPRTKKKVWDRRKLPAPNDDPSTPSGRVLTALEGKYRESS